MAPKPQITQKISEKDLHRAIRLSIKDQQKMLKKAQRIAKKQGVKLS